VDAHRRVSHGGHELVPRAGCSLGTTVSSTRVEVVTDCAPEFLATNFRDWAANLGIDQLYSVAHEPIHNGAVNRAIQTLTRSTRQLLLDGALPARFWPEADGAGRWSDQVVVQEQALQQAIVDMGRARISPSLARYIWRSVLTPKALFPFAVASPPWEELASLELRTWKRFAPLFGLKQPMPLALALGDPAMGGWGLEGWIETLSKTRSRLADHLAHHPSAWVRQLWFSARWGSFLCQSVSGGAQPWLGRESPEWAPTAPNGEHPWTGRSAQLWAQGAVGLLDGWDLCRASEGPIAAYLWHFSSGIDMTRRRALMTKWWAIEQTFTGLSGPTLWPHVCVGERHLIPVWQVPGLSDMKVLKAAATVQLGHWTLAHALTSDSSATFEGPMSGSALQAGIVGRTPTGLRAGEYVATPLHDCVGIVREARWAQGWEVGVEWDRRCWAGCATLAGCNGAQGSSRSGHSSARLGPTGRGTVKAPSGASVLSRRRLALGVKYG
jgi:hypothetical protein